MDVKIKNRNGVKLLTSGKYCDEDLNIVLDQSLIPSGTLEVIENGEHDVASYEKVNVNVAGSSGSTLKKLLDVTKTTRQFFYRNTTITDITGLIEYNDTENVENMTEMYSGCKNLIKILKLNTSKVVYFSSFVTDCQKLKDLTLNTDSCTNFNNFAKGCYLLELIDISKYYCDNEIYSNGFVYNCYSLKAVVIRNFGTRYILNSLSFGNNYHILGTQNATYNPNGLKDGYIYVPRNMIETLSQSTNWSTYATQYRALEDYTLDGTTTGELDWAKMNGMSGQSL